MTHDEAREQIGAVPGESSPELLEHLQTCPECRAYRDEMLAFDARLRRALELDWQTIQGGAPKGPMPKPPPTPAAATVTQLKRKAAEPVAGHARPRVFAFAASVAAALVIGSVLWLTRPPESLAAEVVAHVEGEPNSWQKTETVPGEKLDAVLRKSGVNLGPGMPPVVYASSCWFKGHFVPHVVVTTPHGPVTVMILLHEQVKAAQQFAADGYSGLLVPVRNGSVAVLSRTPMKLDEPAADVVRALETESSNAR
jgi:hypothetical protein